MGVRGLKPLRLGLEAQDTSLPPLWSKHTLIFHESGGSIKGNLKRDTEVRLYISMKGLGYILTLKSKSKLNWICSLLFLPCAVTFSS